MDFGETERKRSYRLNLLIGLIGIAFLLAFGLNALTGGQPILALSLILASAAGLGSLWLMRRTGDPRYGADGISLAAAYVFVYLIVTGGVDATGPLWCFPLVALVTFLQGLRRGSYMVVGLTLVTLLVMFVPNLPFEVAEYGATFKIRFLASFLALALMALIYEYVRAKSQTRYRQISSQLDKVARTDELTGLANRREMNSLMEREYARFARYGQAFSVIMLDLDRFKILNDRFGHAFGDHVLTEVASSLAANIRLTDHAARWGGEEFLILLSQTDLGQASRVAEKLRLAIAEIQPGEGGHRITVTASMGVESIEHAKSIENLVNQADERLYQAKHKGRNLVVAGYPELSRAETG